MHNVYVRGRTRTNDHRVGSQTPNPILPHRMLFLDKRKAKYTWMYKELNFEYLFDVSIG